MCRELLVLHKKSRSIPISSVMSGVLHRSVPRCDSCDFSALRVRDWDVPSCSMTGHKSYSRKLGCHWSPMGKQGVLEAGEQQQERKKMKKEQIETKLGGVRICVVNCCFRVKDVPTLILAFSVCVSRVSFVMFRCFISPIF